MTKKVVWLSVAVLALMCSAPATNAQEGQEPVKIGTDDDPKEAEAPADSRVKLGVEFRLPLELATSLIESAEGIKGRGSLFTGPTGAVTARWREKFFGAAGLFKPINVMTVPPPGWMASNNPRGDKLAHCADQLCGVDERFGLGVFVEGGLKVGEAGFLVAGLRLSQYRLGITSGTMQDDTIFSFQKVDQRELTTAALKTLYLSFRAVKWYEHVGTIVTLSLSPSPISGDNGLNIVRAKGRKLGASFALVLTP